MSTATRLQLKRLRVSSCMSQEDLVEISGIAQSSISGFETGASKPCFDNLIKLADALSVTLDELAGRAE